MQTVALAICVSLGGAGFLVLAICVIMKYRLRRELLISQDTLPRPFEITVPAVTITNTSMRTRNIVSVPMPSVSPRPYPPNGRRGKSAIRREEASAKLVPLRAGSTPTSAMTTPSQLQPSSSRNTRIQPYLSDTSLLLNHAAASSDRFPPRSRSHLHTPISPDPRSQSGQSSSSLLIAARLQGATGVSASSSVSIHERRSAKRALWLSRSASELYCASTSASHNRLPERGPVASSSGYTPPLDGHSELRVDTFVCPTNHLRRRRSASPMVHVERVRSDSEVDLGGAVVFQHQDAGVMQELPPPYHKLFVSS